MKYSFSLLLFILTLNSTFSQKKSDPTPAEIQQAKAFKEKYEDEHIALLKSSTYISFSIDEENGKVLVHEDITEKYISLEELIKFPKYIFYNSESNIEKFSVRNKNGKKLFVKTEDKAYTSDGLFYNDSRVFMALIEFYKLGYSYKVRTEKDYKDIKYFTQLFFAEDYATLEKTVQIEIPKWLDLDIKEFNFEGNTIEKSSKTIENGAKLYTYTIKNLAPRKAEKKSLGPTYIYPHILFLAKSFQSDGKEITLFKDTQDLYNWYKSLTDQLENNNDTFKEKVVSLTKDAKTDEEKIKNIYYWVQDNIRYIAFEDGIAGFKPDEASSVYDKKYGDCKGMANLSKQMLIEAGFDARLTWIGTKRIAYSYNTPSLAVDNHMICTLIKGKDTIFLDGTEKFSAFKEYAYRIQDKEALIENGDNFILKKVPSTNAEFNKSTINYTFNIVDEKLVGKAKRIFTGESRATILQFFQTIKNDKKDEFLESYLNDDDSNKKISNIKTSDLENRETKLELDYDISIKNAVSLFDGIYYIDLDQDKQFQNYDFDKDRKNSYTFGYKEIINYKIELVVPSGYKVSELPKNINYQDDNISMQISFKQSGNKISYIKKFILKNALIDKKDFNGWNKFIKELKSTYNEQITLEKI